MSEKKNRVVASLKLIFVFTAGFLLWKYGVFILEAIVLKYGISALWCVILSRFALLLFLIPFIIWFFLEAHEVFPFRFGDMHASIKMPGIWYGINDNVKRVCIGFSCFCLLLAGIFFYVKQLSVSIVFIGIVFAFVNSILEEILWRGFILSRTTQLCGERVGLLVMSIAFGLYHYPLGFSIPVCLLFSLGGLYFGGVAVCSKGLLFGSIMHISMNILFVSIGIIF